MEALWGDGPPAGAGQALQKQVSRLRQRLGDGGSLVRHRPPGYALDIDPLVVDSRRFEELLQRARVALGRDDPERAGEDLGTALALRRGEALADYRFDEFAQREIARLEELRVAAPRSGSLRSWPADAERTWSASCTRWSPSTRCASACADS